VLILLSVWTIDLARILSHFGVHYLFCTITYGVDATYAGKVWMLTSFKLYVS